MCSLLRTLLCYGSTHRLPMYRSNNIREQSSSRRNAPLIVLTCTCVRVVRRKVKNVHGFSLPRRAGFFFRLVLQKIIRTIFDSCAIEITTETSLTIRPWRATPLHDEFQRPHSVAKRAEQRRANRAGKCHSIARHNKGPARSRTSTFCQSSLRIGQGGWERTSIRGWRRPSSQLCCS